MIYENDKSKKYVESNAIVRNFIESVEKVRADYYDQHLPSLTVEPIKVDVGNKFIRLWAGTSCWGFISRVDGELKGAPIRKGDLLKPATWKSPAKHSRGNIIDGTASWNEYGPNYLK
jgi:hypothetical protein